MPITVITGAASGLGQALACEFSRVRKTTPVKLALCDLDDAGLEATRQLCLKENASADVRVYRLDVTDEPAVTRFAELVKFDFDDVAGVVVNNAGITRVDTFEDSSKESFDIVMDVNFNGTIYVTRAFFPQLVEASKMKGSVARVVNICSMYGLYSSPNVASYHASKFAVRGFTESLSLEVGAKYPNFKVHMACPGFISTNLINNAQLKKEFTELKDMFKTIAAITPQQAARAIVSRVSSGEFRILLAPEAYLYDLIVRFFPSIYSFPKTAGFFHVLVLFIAKLASTIRDSSFGVLGDYSSTVLVIASFAALMRRVSKGVLSRV